MSAPTTAEGWQEAAEKLAEWRAGRSADTFAHALGIDPDALMEWAVRDAMDTLGHVLLDVTLSGTKLEDAIAAALATHTHIGVELGLWLVQTGRVTI